MKKYELLITLPGTLDDKEAEAKIQEIKNFLDLYIQEARVNNLGKSRLAYPVQQIRYGYFYNIFFQAEPGQIQELQEKLRLMDDLLRAIINNYNPKAVKAEKIVGSSLRAEVLTVDELLNQEEKVDKKVSQPAEIKTSAMDLKDIDKRLDEILDDKVISGV